jgi:hypothetical protein
MFGIGDKRAMSWPEFQEYMHHSEVPGLRVLEQKRYEKCPEAPGPGNGVIVGSILVVWDDRAITTSGRKTGRTRTQQRK